MCMSVPLFSGEAYTAVDRYTTNGCLSTAEMAAADVYIGNLNTFYTTANTLYTNQQTALDAADGSKLLGKSMLTSFFTKISNYQALQANFSTYYNYINAFQNNSTDLKTCTIFRTDMLVFSNTICFKTVQGFVDQTIWLCMMGPSICLMSICMFAAIRCPLQKAKNENKIEPYEQKPRQFKPF